MSNRSDKRIENNWKINVIGLTFEPTCSRFFLKGKETEPAFDKEPASVT